MLNWKKVQTTTKNFEREIEFIKPSQNLVITGFYLGTMKMGKDMPTLVHLIAPMNDDGKLSPEAEHKILGLNSTAKLKMIFQELEKNGCVGCAIMLKNLGKKKHPKKPVFFWDWEIYYTDEVRLDPEIIHELLEDRKTIPLTENHQ